MKKSKKFAYLSVMVLMFVFLTSILTGCGRVRTYGQKESYIVFPTNPPRNQTFEPTDPPPVFTWEQAQGFARSFTLEFNYTDSGENPYIAGTTVGGTYYFLPVYDWNTIVNDAPKVDEDGYKIIYWRVRIDDTVTLEDGPYYSDWSYFRIKSDKSNFSVSCDPINE